MLRDSSESVKAVREGKTSNRIETTGGDPGGLLTENQTEGHGTQNVFISGNISLNSTVVNSTRLGLMNARNRVLMKCFDDAQFKVYKKV